MARYPVIVGTKVSPDIAKHVDDICRQTYRSRSALLRLILERLEVAAGYDVRLRPTTPAAAVMVEKGSDDAA
jgi:hypothetical protein